jgi:hypothetical protein
MHARTVNFMNNSYTRAEPWMHLQQNNIIIMGHLAISHRWDCLINDELTTKLSSAKFNYSSIISTAFFQ